MLQLDRWIRIAAVVPVVVFGVATLVASGVAPLPNGGGLVGNPGGGGTVVATSKLSPVVVVSSNGTRAAIMTTERENDDPQRPVQKFGRSFTFVPPTLSQPQALAASTGQTFISSQKPVPGSLATDASGTAIAVWVAGNAGTPELYASHYSAIVGDWSPRLLLATPSGGVTGVSRVAMDGFGRALVVWGDGNGLIHTRVFLPGQGWLTPATQIPGASDVAMRRNQGHALFNDPAGDMFIAQLDNYNWSAGVRVGSGANPAFGSPRLATHRDAPDGSLVAVWATADGIYFNRLTATGPEFASGQKIPGSDNGREPQVVMGANEETTVVWQVPLVGTFANRAVGRVWGTAQRIDSGSNPRLAGDALGNAVLVYASSLENSTNTVFATRFIRASGWQAGEQIGTDMVRQGIADVAMDDNGRGLVVWEQEITTTPDPLDTRIATAVIGAPIAQFTVQPNPAVVGAPVAFNATGSTDPGGSIVFYQWDFFGDGLPDVNPVGGVVSHTFQLPGTYTVKAFVTDNSGLVSEASQMVVVGSGPGGVVQPTIITQPQSLSKAVGDSAAFSVVATGTNLVYQWQKNGVAIPGETNPSLNLAVVQAAYAGSYTVVVSNLVGGVPINSVTSNAAVLTVITYGVNLLINPGFESAVLATLGLPTAPGNWQGDRAESIGADQGITPRFPSTQMLKFIATADVPSTNNLTSQRWQIIDVSAYRADIDATRVRADASAWFNRVIGNGFTDRRFDLRLHAFSGSPSQLPVSYVNPAGVRLAELTVSVDTTGNNWQQAVLQLALPAGTTYLLVEIYAYEDVRNDAVLPEFDGHYADDISLMLIRN